MKRVLFVVSSAAMLAGMTPVFAQEAPEGGAPGGGVVYKSTTKYDFDDDVVEGDLVRPDGEMINTRRAAKHSSLIKIREHFINEMLKSAEDI